VQNAGDEDVVRYMQGCKALIFPGEEDFGIVPLEAQACGKPVIAFAAGGALETVAGVDEPSVQQGQATGIFFHEQTAASLRESLLKFNARYDAFDPQTCRRNALRFDRSNYIHSICDFISSLAVLR
jgi:glycosyltransferase involved in cell wall biosynthesis